MKLQQRMLLYAMDPFAEWVVAWRENRQLGQISRKAWLTALTLAVAAWWILGATVLRVHDNPPPTPPPSPPAAMCDAPPGYWCVP